MNSAQLGILPTINLSDKQEHLMQAFLCTVGKLRQATYVSGPITTGLRFIDWYISTGHNYLTDSTEYQKYRYECVLSGNEADIISAANTLRDKSTSSVIEPASLHIPSWNQQDYHHFWIELMRRFVSRVVVLDGWQYSVGCVIEFQHAIKCGIQVETLDRMLITEIEGRKLIIKAVDDIASRGAAFDMLRQMAQSLKQHAFH